MRVGDVLECEKALPHDLLTKDLRSEIGQCPLAPGIPYVRPLSYFSDALRGDDFMGCDTLHLIPGGLWPPHEELPHNRTARDLEYLTELVRTPRPQLSCMHETELVLALCAGASSRLPARLSP